MTALNHAAFLDCCEVIDWRADSICELADALSVRASGVDLISKLFEWVRDGVRHTGDAGQGVITLRASDVLRERTGLCYAKSHLLVALLRASGIPSGLCYQRLRADEAGESFVLHGLVGVRMPDGRVMRIDPRGNKPGIDAQLTAGRATLAFVVRHPGEADLPGVFARPLPAVVAALSAASHWPMRDSDLPDVAQEHWPNAEGAWRSLSESTGTCTPR